MRFSIYNMVLKFCDRMTMVIFHQWIWILRLLYALLRQLINHQLMLLLLKLWYWGLLKRWVCCYYCHYYLIDRMKISCPMDACKFRSMSLFLGLVVLMKIVMFEVKHKTYVSIFCFWDIICHFVSVTLLYAIWLVWFGFLLDLIQPL